MAGDHDGHVIVERNGVLADPARLLSADPGGGARAPRRRGRRGECGSRSLPSGRGDLRQADVASAEFASWPHFAAKVTGHDDYAERIAEAEPGMPWRTVRAWWRPANWFLAHPSLNGDYFQVDSRAHEAESSSKPSTATAVASAATGPCAHGADSTVRPASRSRRTAGVPGWDGRAGSGAVRSEDAGRCTGVRTGTWCTDGCGRSDRYWSVRPGRRSCSPRRPFASPVSGRPRGR